MNIDESLLITLNKITKKVSQELDFISSHGNEYKIKTYKIDGNYTLEYLRFNTLKQRWEYINGCNLFSTKEFLIRGIESNVIYLYNNL